METRLKLHVFGHYLCVVIIATLSLLLCMQYSSTSGQAEAQPKAGVTESKDSLEQNKKTQKKISDLSLALNKKDKEISRLNNQLANSTNLKELERANEIITKYEELDDYRKSICQYRISTTEAYLAELVETREEKVANAKAIIDKFYNKERRKLKNKQHDWAMVLYAGTFFKYQTCKGSFEEKEEKRKKMEDAFESLNKYERLPPHASDLLAQFEHATRAYARNAISPKLDEAKNGYYNMLKNWERLKPNFPTLKNQILGLRRLPLLGQNP